MGKKYWQHCENMYVKLNCVNSMKSFTFILANHRHCHSFYSFIHSFIHVWWNNMLLLYNFFPIFIHSSIFFSLDLGGSRTFILGLYSAFFALFLVLVIRFFFSFSCLFGPFLHYNCCNMFFFVVAPSKFHV